MKTSKTKTECDRCGTCCAKGGPALHYEDLALLQNKRLNPEHLITIRKGEPVFSLGADNPGPAQSEIIKIKGSGIEWTCFFHEEQNSSCAIYEHRPLECSLLKCWDTADLEKVAGEKLLSRYDIMAPHDPVLPFIEKHDTKCSLETLPLLLSGLNSEDSRQQALTYLAILVNNDLAIRAQAFEEFHFSLDLELFFFGRPLFKILDQLGIETHEVNGAYRLSLQSQKPGQKLSEFS